jgi:hypothetical protein
MPVLTKNSNCFLKKMKEHQKELDSLLRHMKAEGDRHTTWTAAVTEATKLAAACAGPLGQLMLLDAPPGGKAARPVGCGGIVA